MAADKTNNLTIFLTEIADAIREVYNITDAINPQDFASYIKNIPNQGGNSSGSTSGNTSGDTETYETVKLTTTQYGTYYIMMPNDNSLDLIDFFNSNRVAGANNSYHVGSDVLGKRYMLDGYYITRIDYNPNLYGGMLLLETDYDYNLSNMPSKYLMYTTNGNYERGTILIM